MRFHPDDAYSRSGAMIVDGDALVENFEHALNAEHGVGYLAGALESIASVAIARVRLLERELARPASRRRAGRSAGSLRPVVPADARQELAARVSPFPRSGNVIPLPIGRGERP